MPFPPSTPYIFARVARRSTLALVLAGAVIAPVHAQTASPDPLSAAPSAAPLSYRSAFENYRSFRPDPPSEWRGLNDAVRSVGGHSGALKNIPTSAPPPPHTLSHGAGAPEKPAPPAMPMMPVGAAPMPGPRH